LVAGPLIAGLAGAGTGVITGGLIGALVGVGTEDTDTTLYEKKLQEGQILIGIHPKPNDEPKIKLAFEEFGASQIKSKLD
jgi:hypothetical protein